MTFSSLTDYTKKRVSEMKYCPFCGAGLTDEMLFCPKCGKKFQDAIEIDRPDVTDDSENGFPEKNSVVEQSDPLEQVEETSEEAMNDADGGEIELYVNNYIEPKKKPKGKKGIIIAAISCVVVALIICACVLISNGNKKKTDSENSVEINTENETGVSVVGRTENNTEASIKDETESRVNSNTEGRDEEVIDVGNSEEFDITEATNSVLYLEVYDDKGTVAATASGFIVDDGKTLITNYHVIEDAYHIIAKASDGRKAVDVSNIIAFDEKTDLAILKCDSDIGVEPLSLGDSDSVKQGDVVYAVGYPLGIANTLSNGVVSSRYKDEQGNEMIQITAAISHGSSGGALLNETGEVIGVICASYVDGQNLNLAIPSKVAYKLLKNSDRSDTISMSEYYTSQSRIGISANNLLNDGQMTSCGDDIFYDSDGSIHHYNLKTKSQHIIGKGRVTGNINVYKGMVYYTSSDGDEILIRSCDFRGNNNQIIDLPIDLSKSWGVSQMLLYKDYLLISAYYGLPLDPDFEVVLYIINLRSKELVDQTSSAYLKYTYYDNCVYISMEEYGILELNMDSFEVNVLSTFCLPYLVGISDDGVLYYVNSDVDLRDGFYYMDIHDGKEHHDRSIMANSDENGFLYYADGILFFTICDLTTKEITNSYLDIYGRVRPIDYRGVISSVSTIPTNDYIYIDDGITFDVGEGKTVGIWSFK